MFQFLSERLVLRRLIWGSVIHLCYYCCDHYFSDFLVMNFLCLDRNLFGCSYLNLTTISCSNCQS